ncbi:MAG: rod shape-determining protein MreC [Myxococcaceae bacterium]|nr:rod shape-determining protein MreC [Myxococcaceae bacterium]
MFSLLTRFRELLLVAALLAYPFFTYLSFGHKGRAPNAVDRLILALAWPIQKSLTWAVESTSGTFNGYVALRGSHQEAAECRAELSRSKAEINALEQARLENERLRNLLAYTETTVEHDIMARVVGVNASSNFLSMRLDRGEDDGVKVGMPVVTADGVVGQIVRSVGSSSDVMLLSDASSRIGVVVQRTGSRATVAGGGGRGTLSLDNALRGDELTDGDVIVTSGVDGIFPRGIVVGKVEQVQRQPSSLFLQAAVRPAVNLRSLQEVLVIPVPVVTGPQALAAPPGGLR